MKGLQIGIAFGIAVWLLAAPPSARADQPYVKLTPDVIRMDAFYSGRWMRIDGVVAAGSTAVVVIRGPETEEVFNRKARAGPIWINSGKVHISGVPSLFLCYSSEPLARLLRRDEIDQNQLDDLAVMQQMTVTPKEMDHKVIRANFIELKTAENVYRMIAGGLKMGTPGAAGDPFSVSFHWPRKAPPAHYEVRVYEVRGGAIVGKISAPLEVVKVGFPELMAYLAVEHASSYGIAAVLIAALGGFGIDFLAAMLRRKSRGAPLPAVDRIPVVEEKRKAARR
jgi:uncharacterized protein (TIGR02186 family)